VTQRILNAVPTPADEIKIEPVVTLDRALVMPPRLILPNIPPLQDQGATGTCVAHAAYVVYQHAHKSKYGRFAAIGEPEILRFYDLCKKVDGQPDPGRSMGTWLLTALRVMAGSGYPLANGTRGPRITGYEFVGDDYHDTRRAMAQYGSPILFRVDWDANWMYLPSSRIVKRPVGQIVGGHAMASFGYDDNLSGTTADADADRNSWGKWSVNGNGSCYFRSDWKIGHGLEAWRVIGIG
jgi:hypothetical protein